MTVALRAMGAVGLLAAVALAGCSTATSGEASGTESPATESSSPTTAESTEPSTDGPPPDFANTALCELLTAEEATSLGGSATGEPGNSTQDGHPQCSWSDATSLVIGFQRDGQAGEAQSGPEYTNTPTTIADQPAVLSKHVTSVRTNCQVIVDVGETAIVYALAGLHDESEGKYEECDLATQLANIVVPKVLEYY